MDMDLIDKKIEMLEQITDGAAAYHAISFRLVSCLGAAAGGTGQSGDTSKQLVKRPVMR